MRSGKLTADDVSGLFPQLREIIDTNLREKCANVLVEACDVGGWSRESVPFCPVSLRIKTQKMKSQIDHVHAVCAIALSMYNTLEETFRNDTGLRDIILAGALLHDAGKMMEFTCQDGEVGYSASAKLIRHPLGGAILAAKHGLPDEIVHLIATHSFEGEKSNKTLASTIVKMADDAVFSYTLYLDEILQNKTEV